MITIKLNGRAEKVNIGCRTFILLGDLLKFLTVSPASVILNGEEIFPQEFTKATVKGGDALKYSNHD